MNKSRKEINRDYELKNKEKRKQWKLDNRDKIRNHELKRYENITKTGDYRVYVLPNANYYVGQTSVEKSRMSVHKCNGKNTTDYEILHVCDTKEEALWFEAVYHDLGFDGKYGYNSTS